LHTSAARSKRFAWRPTKRRPPAPAPTPEPKPAGGAFWRVLGGLLIVAALGTSAWVYYDSRLRLAATQEELARRLRAIEEDAQPGALGRARIAGNGARDAVEGRGAGGARRRRAQPAGALESLYQELSRNRDEWQLAEIEQVLAIAQQQLQLAGNVRAALLALQLAESRLALADRPQFQSVRRALAKDIERLESLPAADVVGMSRVWMRCSPRSIRCRSPSKGAWSARRARPRRRHRRAARSRASARACGAI
jgi:uroporphyrin-III C-methyltransferase